MNDEFKNFADGVGVVTTAGVVIEILPAITAVLTIIWFAIRIYETKTVQKLLGVENASDTD